ncbi:MAG TPA: NAD(P)-binding domain-containing protein [Terriglobia bacterium]|nr:NAD(P)-binding domain-containing protein [Terriglobia bacterium]
MLYDLVVIGAGPGGIALAAEASACGFSGGRAVVLEKAASHNWAIRQFYPEQKLTAANYKGFAAQCEGLLCISDMTKAETLEYFDRIIETYDLRIDYDTEVFRATRVAHASGGRFEIETSRGRYEARVLAVAIGILGRPNKPADYSLPASLRDRLLFDITSARLEDETVLVVGGGDTAAEYVEHLQKERNRVTLSYRQADFKRLSDRNRERLLGMEERGEVEILRNSNIASVENDSGRPLAKFVESGRTPRVFDRIVYALGGSTPINFLRMLGIAFDEDGPVFDASGETSVPGLFVLGDLVVGKRGGSIITAFNSAVRVMRRICDGYLPCVGGRHGGLGPGAQPVGKTA